MEFSKAAHGSKNDKRIFLNASKNVDGKTTLLAKELFGDLPYKQVNLAEYEIPQVGKGIGDYEYIWNQIKAADILLIGTPIYWSDMSGYLKTFIDHLSVSEELKDADLYVIAQGSATDQNAALTTIYNTLNHVASRFGMNFVGIASMEDEVSQLNEVLHHKMN